ncbi:MAG: hypothetical protein ACP5QA_06030, partial [Phycisphaerae bacterium]
SSASLNMAQQGVLNTVRGLMLSQTLDQNGQTLAVGSYNTTTHVFTPDSYVAGSATATGQIARFWDYPEVGAMSSATDPGGFYQSATAGAPPTPTQYAPSEPWLVSNQPYEPGNFYVPGEEVFYYTTAGTRWVYVGPPNSATASAPPNTTYWALATTPSASYAGASGTTTTTIPLLSTLSPYLYDPGPSGTYGGHTYNGGSYDIPWQVGGTSAYPYPVSVPNAAVVEPRWAFYATNNPPLTPVGTLDAMWNLLPYSSPNGTRYRFATRIIDMSSQLNLNTGWIPSADQNDTSSTTDLAGEYGEFIASAPILSSSENAWPTDVTSGFYNSATPDQVSYIQSGTATIPGRQGSVPTGAGTGQIMYAPTSWQSYMNFYEMQGAQNASGQSLSLFGTNSAMDLLTGADAGGMPFGAPYYSRIATLLPYTLGLEANYYGSGYRGLYTTYSWERDVAAINPGTTAGTAPPKVNLNAPLTSANVGTISTSLYNAMTASGFSPQHALSFVANYLTYRDDPAGYSSAPAYISTTGAVTVGALAGSLSSSITPPGNFVGTTAQPFLNEAEVKLQPQPGGAAPTVVDWAIEVVNPFTATTGNVLPMSNGTTPLYTVTITASTGGTLTVPLAGTSKVNPSLAGFNITVNSYIGVVCESGGNYDTTASGLGDGFVYPVAAASGAFPSPGAGGTVYTITLSRDNLPGGATAVVDSMTLNVPGNIVPDANNDAVYADASRDNAGPSDGIWGCDTSAQSNAAGTLPTTDPGTIGKNNGLITVAGGGPGVPLYDRFFTGGSVAAPGATIDSNDDLFNIDDLNCIARESTTSAEPITQQIGANIAAASGAAVATPPANLGMYYVNQAIAAGPAVDPVIAPPTGATLSPEFLEAALYFDFAYDPRAAYTAADAGFADPAILANGGVNGEVPPTFLSTTTLTDRTSYTSAASALPGGVADLVRQAGKININTASQAVLYSAYSEDGAMWTNGGTPPHIGNIHPVNQNISQLVADTVAFRNRSASGSVNVFSMPTAITTPKYNIYPGVGFRSMGDLLVAFLPTIEGGGGLPLPLGQTQIATIQQRDALWADVENFLTVRSDTFAVYGLVQALRLNPAYSAAVAAGNATYNPTDWYNASQGYVIGTGTVYNPKTISTDPTNQNAEFILEGSRRFIAIVDRSYCNNGAVVQPHIVALKILPQ